MDASISFLHRLAIAEDADERSIKRAYARELKLIDLERDPAAFQVLREAYEAALYYSRDRASTCDETRAETVAPESTLPSFTDPAASAKAAVEHFQRWCAARATWQTDTAPPAHDDAVQHILHDEHLIQLAAREHFEILLAHTLIGGWQPGHELMFSAACTVFDWANDHRRLAALGESGLQLDAAIAQATWFEHEPEAEHADQQNLIERLRDAHPPTREELVLLATALETVTTRFPTWLAMVTDAGNAKRWQTMLAAVPEWRRILIRMRADSGDAPGLAREKSTWIQWNAFLGGVLAFLIWAAIGNDDPTQLAEQDQVPAVPQYQASIGEQIDQDDYKAAILSADNAIAENPEDGHLYALRAMAYALSDDGAHARQDLDAAQAHHDNGFLIGRVRGLVYAKEGNQPAAIAAFTESLTLAPNHAYTLKLRTRALLVNGQADLALKDAEAALAIEPDSLVAHELRAQAAAALGDVKQTSDEAAGILALAPNDAATYHTAANIYMLLGQRQQAMDVLARGIPLTSHSVALLLHRARLRLPADQDGKLRDIKAALAVRPHSIEALLQRANLYEETHHEQEAIADLSAALAETTDTQWRADLLVRRGTILARQGKMRAAQADFDAARTPASTALELNNLCWLIATKNVALNSAMALCDAALAKSPASPQALDSRAFVLLRMGRYKEAIAAYDTALFAAPTMAVSLYGRGLAKRRAGDIAGGDADLQAAARTNKGLVEEFAEMGLRR